MFVLSKIVFYSALQWLQAPVGSLFKHFVFLQPANPRSHANFRKNLSFWCISSPGTYLERCAVKFWPNFHPELLILKTRTFPLCKNNENLEFWSQCKVLCVFVHFSLELIFSSLASSINNLLPLAQDNIFFCLLPRTI